MAYQISGEGVFDQYSGYFSVGDVDVVWPFDFDIGRVVSEVGDGVGYGDGHSL